MTAERSFDELQADFNVALDAVIAATEALPLRCQAKFLELLGDLVAVERQRKVAFNELLALVNAKAAEVSASHERAMKFADEIETKHAQMKAQQRNYDKVLEN